MFPERTKFLRRPIGWKDLGKIQPISSMVEGREMTTRECCPICRNKIRVGKERNFLFWFCHKCEIKIKYPKD